MSAKVISYNSLIARKNVGTARIARSAGGQAMAEFLVSMLMFVPFIVIFSMLTSYLEIQKNAYEAVRFTVWEEASRNIRNINGEVQSKFFKHPYNGLAVKRGDSKNVLHKDQGLGDSFIVDNGEAIRTQRRNFNGINASTDVTYDTNFNTGGRFGNNSLVDVKIEVPLNSGTTFNRMSDPNRFFTVSQGFQLQNLTYEATGAIVANTWMAPNEEVFRYITGSNSRGGAHIRNIERWTTVYRNFNMFFGALINTTPVDELRIAYRNQHGIVTNEQSSVLPEGRVGP